MVNATSEQDEPEAIGWSEVRFLNLAVTDDELLPKNCIFSDELRFTSGQLGGCGECSRMTRELGETEASPFERGDETYEARAESVEKVGHVR